MTENTLNCDTQNGSAKLDDKSGLAAQIARLVRKEGLDYEDWRYVARQVRKLCQLRPAKKGRKLLRQGRNRQKTWAMKEQ